jgi:hypothetical protein
MEVVRLSALGTGRLYLPGKIPGTYLEVSMRWRLSEYLDNQHMEVARLSALGTGRLYLPGKIPGTPFC